ncbi:MAG: hypothetical protein M0Q42_06045 [Xanthomonadales bacterium]|nr:hypothetical protein [Xanthomonadales bacterium]
MPSSISSSEPRHGSRPDADGDLERIDGATAGPAGRRLAIAWLLALVLAAMLLAAWEAGWRDRGFAPEVTDSRQLWALQRDRASKPGDSWPAVFLGASRSVYGIDLPTWREQAPTQRPVMLAINGHHPLAALRDLAEDEDFAGLVICDVDSHGLLPRYWHMQQPWLDYWQRDWTRAWKLHRRLLTPWQETSVLARPDLGLWPTLKRLATGQHDGHRPGYVEHQRDRTGALHFQRTDAAGLAAHFDAGAADKLVAFPAPSPAQWLADLAPVEAWVATIQARGGRVVFVNLPVAGRLTELETRYMPRPDYWDAFAARPGIHALHYLDVPALRALPLPDHSHVDAADRPALTRALVEALAERGWLAADQVDAGAAVLVR